MAGRNPPSPLKTSEKPLYDTVHRELWFRGRLVKRFRQSAVNQELILLSFEEQEWPERIDDPLTGAPGVNSKRRLHDTIKNLNHNQRARLLHFVADGTGRGIGWQPARRT